MDPLEFLGTRLGQDLLHALLGTWQFRHAVLAMSCVLCLSQSLHEAPDCCEHRQQQGLRSVPYQPIILLQLRWLSLQNVRAGFPSDMRLLQQQSTLAYVREQVEQSDQNQEDGHPAEHRSEQNDTRCLSYSVAFHE